MELLHNLLHDTGLWRLARGIISNSFVLTRSREHASAKGKLMILAEFAQISVRKTVAARSDPFTQVLISRTLTVCGEVAERLKAAVC